MAWNLVQSAEGTSTSATVTPTFSSAPTSGNLVILKFASDDYNGTPNTGWTQSAEMEQQTYHGGYLWWQESDGNQPPSYTIGSATNSAWTLEEWEYTGGTWAYDDSQGQLAQSSASSYTTASITPASGDALLSAMFGGSTSSSVDLSADFTGWTNSFTHAISSGPASASGTRDCVGAGYRLVTGDAATAYSTGASYPQTVQARTGLIISFIGTPSGSTSKDVTDSLTPLLSESFSGNGSAVSTESLLPLLSELADLGVNLGLTDTLLPRLDDTGAMLGLLSRAESLLVALAEGTTLDAFLEREDTFPLILTDVPGVFASLGASDGVVVGVADSVNVFVQIATTEGILVVLSDLGVIAGEAGVFEELLPQLVDVPAVSGTLAAVEELLPRLLDNANLKVIGLDGRKFSLPKNNIKIGVPPQQNF